MRVLRGEALFPSLHTISTPGVAVSPSSHTERQKKRRRKRILTSSLNESRKRKRIFGHGREDLESTTPPLFAVIWI